MPCLPGIVHHSVDLQCCVLSVFSQLFNVFTLSSNESSLKDKIRFSWYLLYSADNLLQVKLINNLTPQYILMIQQAHGSETD